jgi:HK97 family phage major capsid protein
MNPRLKEIEARKKEIGTLLSNEENKLELTELENLEAELRGLDNEKVAIEKRSAIAKKLMANEIVAKDIEKPAEVAQAEADKRKWNGIGDFLQAVAKEARGYGRDERLVETRQLGLNEGVPSEGGFLVTTDFANELIKKTYENGILASRANKTPISENANGLVINAIAETSRVTGSRHGGVQTYWLHEAGTKTPSMPAFRQMELKLKKLIGLYYATDELLQDTSALESIVTEAFADDMAFMVDNGIYRGTGVGQPLGITGHAGTVVVPAEAGQAANTILFENIINMWSRCWGKARQNAAWFINQDLEPQLYSMSMAVGVGGVPVYMPAGGISGQPFGTLFGRPVIPIEQASTLGTVGDITLGDFSQYKMIDKGGIQSASSIHVAFTTDQSAFRFVYRCDGQPMWNSVLTPATGSGNTLSPFVQLATRP